MRILQGASRGQNAVVQQINVDAFNVTVELEGGHRIELPYEDVSKVVKV